MREITIKIPEGWFVKAVTVFCFIVAALLAAPKYSAYWAREQFKVEVEKQGLLIKKECPKNEIN